MKTKGETIYRILLETLECAAFAEIAEGLGLKSLKFIENLNKKKRLLSYNFRLKF